MGIEKWVAGYGNMFGYRNDTGKIGKYKDDRDMMRKREISAVTHDMSTMDPMSMNMSDMGKMLEGKTGDALNQAFLEGMIPHHQAAVDMAKYLAASNKPELVKLGVDIITAQQKEIDQMNKWLIEWGYTNSGTTASGMNMDDAMREHCQTMPGMMGCEKYR